MIKKANKFIAVSIVVIQLAMPAFPAFVSDSTPAIQNEALVSIDQVKSISSVLVIINSNISEQLRRFVELACLTSALAHTNTPLNKEEKKNNAAGDSYLPMIGVSNSLTLDTGTKIFAVIKDLSGRVLDNILILCSVFIAILFMGRLKWQQFFYLLPRGTTDDIITILNSFGINPHSKHQMRVFSLSKIIILNGGHDVH